MPGRRTHDSRAHGWARAAGLAFALCCGARAEVVLVVEQSASIFDQAAAGFQQAFGSNTDVLRFDPGRNGINAIADEIRRLNPRLVVTIGTKAAIAVHSKLPRVPILYCLALNPAQNNLRGTAVGGVTFDPSLETQLGNLQRVLPSAKRIGVIYNEPVSGNLVRSARKLLDPGVRLVDRHAQTPGEAARALEELAGNIDAFWLIWDPVIANPANFRLLVEFCLRNKIALVSPAAPFVEAGALMSVGADYMAAGRQAGAMAKEILSGRARPGDFNAEPPNVPMVLVNGAIAKRLGIPIPNDMRLTVLNEP